MSMNIRERDTEREEKRETTNSQSYSAKSIGDLA